MADRYAGLQVFTFGVIGVKACLVNGKVRILAVKCEVCVWCILVPVSFCVCGACVEVCGDRLELGLNYCVIWCLKGEFSELSDTVKGRNSFCFELGEIVTTLTC